MTLDNKKVFEARALLRTAIRNFLGERSYVEVDTPIVVPLPGTEVHLDYFETHWQDFHNKNHKRFLRSSPEIHLKQALSSGLPRVFNLGKCFRNGGEASQWHNPEFTMLEWYETHITYQDFMSQTEDLVRYCWNYLQDQQLAELSLPKEPFQRISVFEAFQTFVGLELIDGDQDLSAKASKKGYLSIRPDDDFETSFFKLMLDVVEPKLSKMQSVFLYDYPASQSALAKVEDGKAKRFELYVNGVELCNAFLELLDPQENRKRLEHSILQRKSLGKQDLLDDEHFFKSLEKGLAPCCGNALGFDRLLALIINLDDMRQIIPFHENQIYPLEH